MNRGFLNAFLWARGSVWAAAFLVVSNWLVVHVFVLMVWRFDGAPRTADSQLCFIDALLTLLGASVELRGTLERTIFWSFHAAEAAVAYTWLWCVFADPGVLRAPLVRQSHATSADECELCGAARLAVLRPHHCRKCRHCVERLDHCCVWIGQDVGARNHKTFIVYVALSLLVLLFDALALWTRLAEIAIAVAGFQAFAVTGTQLLHVGVVLLFATLYSACAYSVLTLFLLQCELIFRDETTFEWLKRVRAKKEHNLDISPPPGSWANVRHFLGASWLELLNIHRAVPPRT